MKYNQLEISILHLYASDSDLFAPCENYAFQEIWQEESHKSIFKIIKDNHAKKAKTDLSLLKNGLSKLGYEKEDIKSILQNFNNTDSSLKSNIKAHMEIVFEMYCRRKLKPVLHKGYTQIVSQNGDIEENTGYLKDAFNEIDSIKNNLSVERNIEDIFDEALTQLLDAQNSTSDVIGHSYGLRDLDKLTSGAKKEIIVIGARPGAGKSSLMINIAKHIAIDKGEPMVIFSLEMPAVELMKNIWANVLEINSWQIRSGNVSDEDLLRIKKLKDRLKRNLIIDDTPGITHQYVRTKIKALRRNIPLHILITVMIDYLQLMKNTSEETKGLSKEEQVGVRCNGLLETSKTENLCLIELSQLTREVEKRDPPRPLMSDLKDSGAIEANAVQVWLLYRPDYYNPNPTDKDGTDLRGLCEINVAKNRYGSTGRLYVKFEGKYSAFKDYNREDISSNEEF